VGVRFVCALLVLAGLGIAACGGSSHARAAAAVARPATTRCSRSASYPVRSAHISATRRATTSSQIRHFDPTAWFPARPGAGCRFPLIEFSPGANSRPVGYTPLLSQLASQGFVVIGVLPMDQTAQHSFGAFVASRRPWCSSVPTTMTKVFVSSTFVSRATRACARADGASCLGAAIGHQGRTDRTMRRRVHRIAVGARRRTRDR
jgi:hypothetical protein